MADDDSTTKPDEGEKPAPEAKKETPPWGEDFDAERAWRTIQSLRAREKELEPLAAKAQELEQAQKTETERLTERLTAAEARALDAARYEVALDKGLTRSQAKRLVGSTLEELAADADELLADLGKTETAPVTRRPTERLRGGSEPEQEPEEKDTRKIAERMFAR